MSMTPESSLDERLRELEGENAQLRAESAARQGVPRLRTWVRGISAVLCIVVASILVPVGVLVTWADNQLLDEDRFIATFAPLAENPVVQAEISVQVTGLIDRQLDIDGLTNSVIDGIVDLGLPSAASSALQLLRQPAADGVRNMVASGVEGFVESEAFAVTWEQALRLSHRALIAAATSGESSDQAVSVDASGVVAIQLAPIIEGVKTALIERGFEFASAIPAIEAEIPLAQTDVLPMLSLVVALTSIAGWWLPIITLVLFAAGVLLAPRRSTALLGAGIGLIIGSAVVLVMFRVIDSVLNLQAASIGVKPETLSVLMESIFVEMRGAAVSILILGILVLAFGWVVGRSRWAVALRRRLGAATAAGRQRLAERGAIAGENQVPGEVSDEAATIDGDGPLKTHP